ncbi:MAG: O-antigen ligase family protein [Candidatus Spechtbacterales bacterium]|nr:O-antigen ligase family protein [Candidatus Spechtbacterales bacterium]
MFKKLSSPINIIFFVSLSIVVLIAFGIIPREAAFIFLLMYVLFVLFYPVERGVDLFLRSIPFFIALPITESFDNFNIWRLILALIFIKWFFSSYDWKKWLRPKLNISRFIKENKIEAAGILFLLFALLSIFVGPNTIAGAMRFIFILNALMLFIVIRSLVIKDKENAWGFARNFAYSGLLAVAFGYLQFLSAYFVPAWIFHYWWGQIVSVGLYGQQWGDIATNFGNTWFSYSAGTLRLRMFSTFPDTHSFPMYVIMTFPALFIWISRRFSWLSINKLKDFFKKNYLIFIGFALINLALILTGTRGIWIASLATLAVVGLFKFFKVDKKYNKVLLGSLLIFLLMFPVYFGIVSFPQFQDTDFEVSASFARISSIIDFGETSNQGRIGIWKTTLAYIAHSPVLGVGIGNYPVILTEPQSALEAGASAHNLYLHIASTMGVFALFVFLWFIFELIKASVNYLKENREYGLYFAFMLFSLAWIGAYLMTDAALYDGRALLGFMAMTGIGAGLMRGFQT